MEKQRRKRKNLTADERRATILSAALELFSRRGFSGTTVRQLARKAGVTEAVLYQHFPSKEALFNAILERRMDENRRSFFPVEIAKTKQDQVLLETIIGTYLKRYTEDSSFMRILLFSALEGHALAQEYVRGPMQEFFDFFGSYLEERMKDGAMKNMDGELASRLIMGMAFAFTLLREVLRDPKAQDMHPEDVTKAMVDLICNGLGRSSECTSSAA